MFKSFIKFAGVKFFAILLIAVSLFIMLGAAQAGAAECHAYEADCYSRPLTNGRPGEMVRVCEKVKLVCASEPVRKGTTYISARMGAR